MLLRSATQYAIERLTRLHARRVLARFMADARNATAVQERLLRSLVRANADSGYGRAHGFASIRNYEDFIKHVPISTYADLSPWVDRVKSGDVGAMFGRGQRVHMFAMTSGTVDTPKYVPVTDRFLKDQRAGWTAFGVKALVDHRGKCFMRPLVQVVSPMDEEWTKGGIPCGAITGLMAGMQKKIIRKYYVVPPQVAYVTDVVARRYTIMRLAMPSDIGWIVTASPATVLQLARTGETFAESIIRDIRDGTIARDQPIPESVRAAIDPLLTPDPQGAARLERLRSERGRLLPRDYWDLGFLANWTGGSMGLYLQDYPEYFGNTPVRDIGLLATEGRMSVPIEDRTPVGVAAVSSVFFEFIPAAEYGKENAVVLRSNEVEPGRDYFILLTTSAGFYRYDICDCVRVVGFRGGAPIIEFLHKGAHVSSITGEKLTERQVVLAAERTVAAVGVSVSSFVLAPRWSDPPYYRLYLEPPAGASEDWSLRLTAALDENLRRVNIEYASKRTSGRLGGVEACPLAPGTIKALDDERATRFRRSNEQFKHQYLYTSPGDDTALAKNALRGSQDVDKRIGMPPAPSPRPPV